MKIYQKLLADFEELYLGYASIGIIASSCIGSIAAMLIFNEWPYFIKHVRIIPGSFCMYGI